MAAAMVAGLTACDDETPANSGGSSNNSVAAPAAVTTTTSASTTTDANDALDLTDKDTKEFDTSLYQPSGHAGTVKYLGYYDITSDQKGTEQCLIFQSDLFGGKIEYTSTASGPAFFEKLLSSMAHVFAPLHS